MSSEHVPSVETEVERPREQAGAGTPADGSAGASAEAPTDEVKLDPLRWAALLVLLVSAFMDLLDGTIANVAAPSMQRELGAGYSAIQWILVGYQLAFALLLILGGRLGDIFGRKKVFLIGVAGFTLTSLTAGLAQEPWQLVVSRVLQGAFSGIMVPQVLSIIHVTFSNKERGTAFALHGLVGGLAATLGLALGGLMVQWNLFGLDWRLIFLVNVPVGLFGLFYGSKVITESRAPQALRLDVTGVLLATVGMLMLIFPLLQGREMGWPTLGFVSMAGSLLVLTGFVLWQKHKIRKDGSPLVELGLFRTRSFSSGLAVNLIFYIGMGMFTIGWTLYMQIGMGWSPMRAGLTSLPFCLGAFMTATTSVMILVPKFGRKALQVGAVVLVAGLGAYIWVAGEYGSQVTSWHLAIPLFLIGLGFGTVATPLPLIVTSEVPHKDAGSASGLVNTNTQLGFAIGGALVSVVFFGGLVGNTGAAVDDQAPQLRKDLVAVAGLSPERADEAVAAYRTCTVDRAGEKDMAIVPESCSSATVLSEPAVAETLEPYAKDTTGVSFAASFQTLLWTFIGITAVVFFLLFAVPRRLRQDGPEDAVTEERAAGATA
ncbi:MFS transporter [Streptomyces barkulensis]|uniref:MFS transporter n=1 Tax=Streptomyces barkulensis TaxID=1257026 RepID=UPI001F4DCBD7|nr:MFS transporter [Streptomyces barkulensis]